MLMVRAGHKHKKDKTRKSKKDITMQSIHGNGSNTKKSSHRLAGISSMVGTTIEWYDFLFTVRRRHSFLISYFSQI